VITVRLARNCLIGDKYASRSAQKGVVSSLLSKSAIPFSDSVVINPDVLLIMLHFLLV